MHILNNPKMGFHDGLPICLGYFAISFAFGLTAVSYGIPIFETVMISAFNLTSAGQLAALPIIASAGSYVELCLTQLLINLRYSLMSISLSQKFDSKIRTRDKLYLAFALTDEMFAVSVGRPEKLSRRYILSLLLLPFLGWTLGTLCGTVAGNILPAIIVTALGVSMYAMFIAIVVPAAKKSRPILIVVLFSMALSIAFKYIPVLNKVPGGFVIIISALISSIAVSVLFPIDDGEVTDNA